MPSAPDPTTVPLPAGFVFGTATAAYQIEGATHAGGRGTSIWDTFSHTPGKTVNGDTGDIACRHYELFEDDLDLMAELGAGAYRFSISWPRIQSTGKGPANTEGLDFYRRLVGGLLARGISPMVTLYHWDLPQPLEDAGGWAERDTISRFAEFAAVVADALGPDVSKWITLNEPWCSAWLGYGSGHHAPGKQDIGLALAAHHHLLVAHGEAAAAIRAAVSGAQVGIALNLQPVRPASDHPDDVAAAHRVDGNHNRIYTGPLFGGAYPADMLEHYRSYQPGLSVIRDSDLAVIARPVDFVGINYYSPGTVADVARAHAAAAAGYCVPPAGRRDDPLMADLRAIAVDRPAFERTEMGWEVEPDGLTELLLSVHQDCGGKPVFVTENGAACNDYIAPGGCIRDPARVRYLDGHIRAALRARELGANVAGYFVWSLLDNFEWAFGYSRRFGLVWVDYPSGTRITKDSFRWYQQALARKTLLPVGEALAEASGPGGRPTVRPSREK